MCSSLLSLIVLSASIVDDRVVIIIAPWQTSRNDVANIEWFEFVTMCLARTFYKAVVVLGYMIFISRVNVGTEVSMIILVIDN